MNNLADIFEAELKGLAANFVESSELKFLHWLRKTQAKLFSSESSCLLRGKRSLVSVREDEKCWSGCWGPHFPKMVPSLLPPQAGGEGTLLDSNSSLTCMATHILLLLWVLGKSCSLENACQGLFPPSFSSTYAGGRLLTSCSSRHLCRPITSPLLRSGPPPLRTLSLSFTLS